MQTKMLVQVLAGTVIVAGSWGERALAAGESATLPPAPAAVVTSPAPRSNLPPVTGGRTDTTVAYPPGAAAANGGFVQNPNAAPNAAPLSGNRPAGAGLENMVTMKLNDIPLAQYCSYLSSMANLPVTCDPALADRKISVDLNDASVLEAADTAASQVGGRATVITAQTPATSNPPPALGTVPGPKISILIAPLPGK